MLSLLELAKRAQERSDFLATIAVTTGSPYASGNVLGGLITIDKTATAPGPNPEAPMSSILQNICVIDPDATNKAIDFFFFRAIPTATITDKAAFAPSLADLQNCIGVVSVAAADYVSGGANGSVAGGSAQSNLGKVLKPGEALGTAIYCVPVVRSNPTYTNGSLYVRFQFSQGL